MKKILVIYTGGTFGMRPTLQKAKQKPLKAESAKESKNDFKKTNSPSTFEIPELSASELKLWLKTQVPEMMELAACDVDVLFNMDSCQFQAEHWFELAAHLHAKQKNYDGAVILHGTDTLPYTAAALSFLLSPSRIPIVITGAQKPLATLRNDARTNLISALEIATNAPKELRNRVLVAFHDEVFLGSRVRKKSAVNFSAFESPRFPKLASIGSEILYHDIIHSLPALSPTAPLLTKFKANTENGLPQILQAQMTPQFCSSLFKDELLASLDGLLLTLYTSGTAPTAHPAFLSFLERACANQTPVFAITEREAPGKLTTYAAGRELIRNDVLWCEDLTPEAAFVKIWLLRELYANRSRDEHYLWLQKNWMKPMSDECTQ